MPDIQTGKLVHATVNDSPQDGASIDIPGLATIGVAHCEATENGATSSVDQLSIDPSGLGTIVISADSVAANCNPPETFLAGLSVSVGGIGIDVPANPDPNTEISLGLLGVNIATLTLNEQVVEAEVTRVTALRLELLGGVVGALGSGNVRVAQAICRPVQEV